jgi:hypothetical protein
MPTDRLETLQAINPAILESVVSEDQRSSSFQITNWSVRRLSGKGIINPEGLWLFSGRGHDSQGARDWSVVLKILDRQTEEPPINDMWNWRRELLVAQSGLTTRLPGPVKAPRFYRSEETPGGGWIWMEHVQDLTVRRWTLDNYSFAARQVGRWNGACAMTPEVRDEPWLVRQQYRSWLGWIDQEAAWQFPPNKSHISSAYRRRHAQLWAEREWFYDVIERLPQIFSHQDCQRRNLFVRRGIDQPSELVAIDWAQCGLGPLGAELNHLVGMSAVLLEWPPAHVRELEAAAFENYLEGLGEARWSGNPEVVRLGFVAYLAAFVGCALPGATAWWGSVDNRQSALDQFGVAEEDLFWQWLPLYDYALDCADEARRLAAKLGV